MIKLILTSVFIVIGLLAGYVLLKLSDRITVKKAISKNIKEQSELFNKGYIRLIISIANATAWGLAAWWGGGFLNATLISVIFSLAIMVTMIDFRIYIIPNELVIAMAALGIMFQLSYFGLKSLLIAAICMLGLMSIFLLTAVLMGFRKVGAGDVKLAGVMGLVLGYPHILTGVMVMCLGMMLYIIVGFKTYKLNLKSMFAYGPFMMLGLIAALVTIVGKIPIF